jgi:pectinesterase
MAQYDEEEITPDDLLTNMIIMGASLIVIAAVVIAVVAGIDNKGTAPGNPINPRNVTVDAICKRTDYTESCMASLQPVGAAAGVETYLRAAANATIVEMTVAMKKAKVDADAIADHDHQREKMAFEDCIELIGLCIEELQSVRIPVVDVGDARSSLSAVISYQRACLEGLNESHSTSDMDRGLQKSIELASIVLAIIYENFPNDDFEAKPAATPRRRTDEDQGIENDGYPDQRLSAEKRKLLQTHEVGQSPNAVVAKDGSGDYGSITAALDAYPDGFKGRYFIYVMSGVYEENVIIAKNKTMVFMYGDGVDETIISGRDVEGTTYRRATLCEFLKEKLNRINQNMCLKINPI